MLFLLMSGFHLGTLSCRLFFPDLIYGGVINTDLAEPSQA